MILTYIIDIDETLKLTQGQGHKVKGRSWIDKPKESVCYQKEWLLQKWTAKTRPKKLTMNFDVKSKVFDN